MCGSFFYCQLTVDLAAAGDEWLPMGRPGIAAFGGRESRRLAAETKGGKGTVWFPCPLLTPPNPP